MHHYTKLAAAFTGGAKSGSRLAKSDQASDDERDILEMKACAYGIVTVTACLLSKDNLYLYSAATGFTYGYVRETICEIWPSSR